MYLNIKRKTSTRDGHVISLDLIVGNGHGAPTLVTHRIHKEDGSRYWGHYFPLDTDAEDMANKALEDYEERD